jgi:hypothetical protein
MTARLSFRLRKSLDLEALLCRLSLASVLQWVRDRECATLLVLSAFWTRDRVTYESEADRPSRSRFRCWSGGERLRDFRGSLFDHFLRQTLCWRSLVPVKCLQIITHKLSWHDKMGGFEHVFEVRAV